MKKKNPLVVSALAGKRRIASVIIGVDVSTAVSGVAVVDYETLSPLLLCHIDTSNLIDVWSKSDKFRVSFEEILIKIREQYSVLAPENIKSIYVEQALLGFKQGKSSAKTISSLMKFNGIASYIIRELTRKDPTYVISQTARKLCMLSKCDTPDGNMKSSALNFTLKSFKCSGVELTWCLNRNQKFNKSCYDESDAFVLAVAGAKIKHSE